MQESRRRLARKIRHRKCGQIHQKHREGQEHQLRVLGIVLNAVTLWNTRYLAAAVSELRDQGRPVREQDVARLSPLGHAHVIELGRYPFRMLAPDAGLRPLRDRQASDEQPGRFSQALEVRRHGGGARACSCGTMR